MDHSIAHLIEFSENSFEIETIETKFTHEEKEKSLAKGESFMHNKIFGTLQFDCNLTMVIKLC